MNHQDREHLAGLLGEAPAALVPNPVQVHAVASQPRAIGLAGPWRATASMTGGLVQISNHQESDSG